MSVCVLGALNLDHVTTVPALPPPGTTVLATSLRSFPGGKGLNQAVAAARMGSATMMLGAIGDDAAGAILLEALGQAGVDAGGIAVRAGLPSGQTHIAVAADGENHVIMIAGANGTLVAEQGRAAAPDARVFLAQLETPIEATEAFFTTEAAQKGRKILNAAPALAEGARLFAMADMLIFNQAEFATYLQLDAEPRDVEALLPVRRLLTRPNQAAVVTFGAIGAAAIWADRTLFVEAFPTTPVDTTGAGDCFCGTVAAAVDQGIGPERALALANAAASLSTMEPGASTSMPSRARIDALAATRPVPENAR